MEKIEIIKKCELRCKFALTDDESLAAAVFFSEREAERAELDNLNIKETDRVPTEPKIDQSRLRDDVPSPDADREAFLSLAPEREGAFVRVPRAL